MCEMLNYIKEKCYKCEYGEQCYNKVLGFETKGGYFCNKFNNWVLFCIKKCKNNKEKNEI